MLLSNRYDKHQFVDILECYNWHASSMRFMGLHRQVRLLMISHDPVI